MLCQLIVEGVSPLAGELKSGEVDAGGLGNMLGNKKRALEI